MNLYQGTIDGVSGSFGSGIATLSVNGRAFHADNGPLFRALDAAFPGFIVPGHQADPEVIQGEEIVLYVDELGLVAGFVPADEYYGEDVPEEVK